MKTLIIYYSFDGNTKFIAQSIQKEISCDLLELKPSNEIKTHGFMKFFWGGKQVLMKETPALLEYNTQFDDYDLIIIGTPVWSYTFAPPLRTFFTKKHFLNKKVALYCSHEGGMKNTFMKMEKELLGNQIVGRLDFNNRIENQEACKQKAQEWIQQLQF